MGPKSRWGGGVGSSGDRLCQTSPLPRSPDGDKKIGLILKREENYTEGKADGSFTSSFSS